MSEEQPSRETSRAVPDTSTLSGIVRYAEMWLLRDENAPAVELVLGCQYIAFQLEKTRDDIEEELASTGEADERSAAIEAYEQIRDIVLSLAEYVDDGKRRATKTCLAELKRATLQLREAQKALGDWSRLPQLRCPGCGGTQGDPCPSCGLELLYLESEMESDRAMASFPKEYGNVFRVYSQVASGKATLSTVFASLEPLKRSLRNSQALVKSSSVEAPDSAVLLQLQECLEGTLAGVAQMELTAQTRRMIDLRVGWYQVYENGVRFKELRQKFLEEFGGEDSRALVQQEQDGLM